MVPLDFISPPRQLYMSLALATGKNSHGIVSARGGPRAGRVIPAQSPCFVTRRKLWEKAAFGTVLAVRLTSCSPGPGDKPVPQVRCHTRNLAAAAAAQGCSSSSPKVTKLTKKDHHNSVSTTQEAGHLEA